jgi:hypothetical protein
MRECLSPLLLQMEAGVCADGHLHLEVFAHLGTGVVLDSTSAAPDQIGWSLHWDVTAGDEPEWLRLLEVPVVSHEGVPHTLMSSLMPCPSLACPLPLGCRNPQLLYYVCILVL